MAHVVFRGEMIEKYREHFRKRLKTTGVLGIRGSCAVLVVEGS